jgi:hypothetical protein
MMLVGTAIYLIVDTKDLLLGEGARPDVIQSIHQSRGITQTLRGEHRSHYALWTERNIAEL